jgi:hypothetical protein
MQRTFYSSAWRAHTRRCDFILKCPFHSVGGLPGSPPSAYLVGSSFAATIVATYSIAPKRCPSSMNLPVENL